MGILPPPVNGGPTGGGTVSTPAPIAGAGALWVGIAGAGYLIYRGTRKRK